MTDTPAHTANIPPLSTLTPEQVNLVLNDYHRARLAEMKSKKISLTAIAKILSVNILTLRKMVRLFTSGLTDYSKQAMISATEVALPGLNREGKKPKLDPKSIEIWYRLIDLFYYDPLLEHWYYR